MEMKLRGSYALRPEDSHEIGPTPRCRKEGWMFQFPVCTRASMVGWWGPATLAHPSLAAAYPPGGKTRS